MSEKKIVVVKYEIPLDPRTTVFNVELGDDKSTWLETIPTEECLRWFLCGVQAGASTYANKRVDLPEIPHGAIPMPIRTKPEIQKILNLAKF